MYSVFGSIKSDLYLGCVGGPMYLVCHVVYACCGIVHLQMLLQHAHSKAVLWHVHDDIAAAELSVLYQSLPIYIVHVFIYAKYSVDRGVSDPSTLLLKGATACLLIIIVLLVTMSMHTLGVVILL